MNEKTEAVSQDRLNEWATEPERCEDCGNTGECGECQVLNGEFDDDPAFQQWEAEQIAAAEAAEKLVTFHGPAGGTLYADGRFEVANHKLGPSFQVQLLLNYAREHYSLPSTRPAAETAPAEEVGRCETCGRIGDPIEKCYECELREEDEKMAAQRNAEVLASIPADRMSPATLRVLQWHVTNPIDSFTMVRGYFAPNLTNMDGPCTLEAVKFTKWGTVKVNLRLKEIPEELELAELRREAEVEQAELAKAFARAAKVKARDLAVHISILTPLQEGTRPAK